MTSSPESLAILGGTFDPPHLGHLIIAQAAFYRFRLGRVVFSPAAQNPLKPADNQQAGADTRLSMLRLAVENDARFSVDAFELRRGGTSYTIDTLRRYRERLPRTKLYFLVGADVAEKLEQWKDIHALAQLCTFAIYPRAGSTDFSNGLPAQLAGLSLSWEYIPLECWPVSSSIIRRRVREGKPIRYYVPDAVADFIHQHELYR